MFEKRVRPGVSWATAIAVIAVSGMPQGCCCLSGYFGYVQKNGQWVYVSMAGETSLDADETLTILSDSEYAKDRTKVFRCGHELKGSDPATFELDSKADGVRYAHDQHRVYFDGTVIRDADPATFELIDSYYSRDATRVYCGTVPMHVAHPDDFEVVIEDSVLHGPRLPESIERTYGKEFADWPIDDYYFMVTTGWARDGEFWYWGPSRIEGADYETFKPIDREHAADKHGRFFGRVPEEVWLEEQQQNAAAAEPLQAPAE